MQNFQVSGTYVWYYCICKREVWLMSRAINPDQDHQAIDIGRFIHEKSYDREKKEITHSGMKFDIFMNRKDKLIIGEIKKSSRSLDSAKMQLLFYLFQLEQDGIIATGQLLIPEEKLRIDVNLDEESRIRIIDVIEDIISIVNSPKALPPQKCSYCKSCAYAELCWA